MTAVPVDPFGVDYLRPVQPECPRCRCCTEALCRRGRTSVLECAGCTDAEHQATVVGCPCSSSSTEGTAAWRMSMVAATLQAVELPLPDPMEAHLRALADDGRGVVDPHHFHLALRLRGFVQTRGDVLEVTSQGRAYLAARDGGRVAVRGRVLDVDVEENTARVLLDVCREDQRATVLVDQLSGVTGVDVYELPGLDLEVVANVDAERVEDIVLTRIQARPAPLPDQWRKAAPEGEGADGD